MQFMVSWTFTPDAANAAIERFAETGGLPPDGVKMLGRWHDTAANRGWAVAEADDTAAMGKWTRQWNDLLEFEIVPLMSDDQLKAVIAES
jgi:hypothetical protein